MTISDALARLTDEVRLRRFSYKTEKAYRFWLQSYMVAVAGYPVDWSSVRKVERFLTDEASRGVSASTQNQALNALVFFYEHVLKTPLGRIEAARARRTPTIRTALSPEDALRMLETVEDVGGYPTRLICWLIYGCGLRVSEPLELRLKDVNLAENFVVIRGAKGGKDRIVELPQSQRDAIVAQIRVARAVWRGDAAAGRPVSMPGLMGRKAPRLAFTEAWAWLFPAHHPSKHPRSGREERWRMHDVNVQRAVRAAAVKLGLAGRVTPHVLRHSYATHAHRDGAPLRDLQQALGHAHLDTTMRYLAAAPRVASPADRLVRPGTTRQSAAN